MLHTHLYVLSFTKHYKQRTAWETSLPMHPAITENADRRFTHEMPTPNLDMWKS